jgi:hypothetical protein
MYGGVSSSLPSERLKDFLKVKTEMSEVLFESEIYLPDYIMEITVTQLPQKS